MTAELLRRVTAVLHRMITRDGNSPRPEGEVVPEPRQIETPYGTAQENLRDYGGGEAYLRDLRANWYGRRQNIRNQRIRRFIAPICAWTYEL